MKGKVLFVILFLLLTGAILSAEVQLDRKSKIVPSRTNFKIAYPQFALNTQSGDTLILWVNGGSQDGKDPIVGRIVNAKGKTVGKAFTIVTLDGNPLSVGLSLAYNPITNEFLLAFNQGSGPTQIFVLRMTSDGHPSGKAIDITSNDPRTAPYSNGDIALKFNPKTGGYTLLFFQTGLVGVPGDSFHFYALLTEKGALSAPLQKIDEYLTPYFTDYAYLPSADKLLILAWLRAINTPTLAFVDYGLATVDLPKLKNLKIADFATISRVLIPDPSLSRLGSRFLGQSFAFPSTDSPIVFYTGNQNVEGRKIDTSGKLSGRPFKAFKSPVNTTQLYWPTAAFSTTAKGVRGVLIAVEDEGLDGAASIWAQVLKKNGKPTGTPIKLYTTADTEKIGNGGTIIALPVKPGDTVLRFVWYGLLQRREDFDPLLSYYGQGSQILKLNISLTTP